MKQPNTPEYAQVLVVAWAKPNFVTVPLSPRPSDGAVSFVSIKNRTKTEIKEKRIQEYGGKILDFYMQPCKGMYL